MFEYNSGGAFGELALLHGEPRLATVRATENCVCWALDRDTFRKIMMSTGRQVWVQGLGFRVRHDSFRKHILSTGRQIPLFRVQRINRLPRAARSPIPQPPPPHLTGPISSCFRH